MESKENTTDELAKGIAKEFYAIVTRVAVLESRISERDDALVMQAREYERRLDELNHAHAIQIERDAQSIKRDVFEAKHGALITRLDLVERQLVPRAEWENHRAAIETRFSNNDSRVSTTCGAVDDRLNEFDRWRARIIGISVGISIGAGLAGGIISALISKLFK